MKKICFLSSNISLSGGTERVGCAIANSLQASGNEILMLSLFSGRYSNYQLNDEIKLYSLSDDYFSLSKNFFKTVKDLRSFLKENNVDILVGIESTLSLLSLPSCLGLNTKFINWEHYNYNSNKSKVRVIARKLACNFADAVVTLTDKDKNVWLEHQSRISNTDIICINNPALIASKLKKKNDFDKCNKVISLGRFSSQKGFDLLIKAWANLSNEYSHWSLDIYGDGEDKDNLEKLISDLNISNSISLLPFSDNVDSIYNSASFYVMSSRFEGLPMVLLEAISHSLPIVSFDCDTGPSEIITDNWNGYLVEPDNIEDLTINLQKMMSLSDVEYANFSNNSYEKVNKFSIEVISKQWRELVENVYEKN